MAREQHTIEEARRGSNGLHSAAALRWLGHPRISAVPFVLLALWHWDVPPPAMSADWAQYVLHARALLEGRPYSDTGYLFTPLNPMIGPRAFPPGLPLTLVPLLAAGGLAPALMRLLMIVSGAAFVTFAARRLAQEGPPWLGVLAAMWLGVALEAVWASVMVLSDLGFCALVWGVIVIADRPGSWSWRRTAAVVAVIAAAASYRVAAVALPPALALYGVLNWRQGKRPLVAASLFVLGGLAALPLVGRFQPAMLLPPSVAVLVSRVSNRVLPLTRATFEGLLYPFGSDRLNDGYHAVAVVLLLVGLVAVGARWRRSFLAAVVLVYGAMLVVSPVIDTRYVWPLWPLLAYLVLAGLRAAVLRLTPWTVARVETGVATLALVAMMGAVVQHVRKEPARGFNAFPEATEVVRYVSALPREANSTPARVSFAVPRMLALEAGVPSMGLLPESPSRNLQELIDQGITHVVVGSFEPERCDNIATQRMVEAYPTLFTRLTANARFQVYRFQPPVGPVQPTVTDRAPYLLGLC